MKHGCLNYGWACPVCFDKERKTILTKGEEND